MVYEPTIVYDAEGYASVTPRGAVLGVSVIWVPNARNAGGTYGGDGVEYPWRLLLHEIQGGANYDSITGHPYPPHNWYDPSKRILFQTVPLGRSAFALWQEPSAPYKSNKAHCIQTELSGYSEFVANEPQAWLDNIAEDVLIPECMWVSKYKGQSIDLTNLPKPWQIAGSAYTTAPQRFSDEKWRDFNGLCTHANSPHDEHYDTGALDIWRICEHARLLIAGLLNEENPVEEEDEDMFRCLAAPDGTLYIVRAGKKITVNQLCKDFNQPDKDVFLNELFNAGMLKDKFWTNIGWYGLATIPWSEDAKR